MGKPNGLLQNYRTLCFPQNILRTNGLQFLLGLTIVEVCLCKILKGKQRVLWSFVEDFSFKVMFYPVPGSQSV